LVDSIEECAVLREQLKDTIANDTVIAEFHEKNWEDLQLKAAMTVGAIFIDHLAHHLIIKNEGYAEEKLVELADAILQAARIKFVKPEYISCPGCGRTLYNLEDTIARIRAAVSERALNDKRSATLKIGIMGCIVNGPGEMADADYGYVGAGVGKVSLYKQKVCVEKNIPEKEAVERLIQFIDNDLTV
jgi:(E)-4-hydroxy-3-methylbut-2-enyl-diphosphate synthase